MFFSFGAFAFEDVVGDLQRIGADDRRVAGRDALQALVLVLQHGDAPAVLALAGHRHERMVEVDQRLQGAIGAVLVEDAVDLRVGGQHLGQFLLADRVVPLAVDFGDDLDVGIFVEHVAQCPG